MNFYKIVEIAKQKQGLTSDNQIAIKLNVSRSLVSGWKTGYSMPDGINTLKLTEMAGISSEEAIRIVQSGYSSVTLLIMTALGSTLAFTPIISAIRCILC
jgi:ribosome-binding protein aMBF1 (putative translation factor)